MVSRRTSGATHPSRHMVKLSRHTAALAIGRFILASATALARFSALNQRRSHSGKTIP
jgi:hypothetical protein